MKLVVEKRGIRYALVEDANAPYGLAFSPVNAKGKDAREEAGCLTTAATGAIFDADGCNEPSKPDIWSTCAAAAEDFGAKIVEFEDDRPPEGTVF